MDAVLEQLPADGEPVALATVVSTWSSAPRERGARMLIRVDGSVVGSVSGGCVEADVHARAMRVLAGGEAELVRYGVSDHVAAGVGMTCGGTIEVLVQRIADTAALRAFASAVKVYRPAALATIVTDVQGRAGHQWVIDAGGVLAGGTGGADLDDAVIADAAGLLRAGQTGELSYGPDGSRLGVGVRVLVEVAVPSPRLIVAGATEFAVAVASLSSYLGFAVTVCDARATFASPDRFPDANVVIDWPHRYLVNELAADRVDCRTVLLVLTHDPKFDEPLLEVALGAGLGFIGAMGSRRTHAGRIGRLRARGVTSEALEHLHSPVGLDIGGRSPRETALSILAEVIAKQSSATGRPLSELTGPLHRDAPEESPRG